MSNCPQCRRVVFPKQEKCECGWKNQDYKPQAYRLDRCGWNTGCPDVGTMRSGHDGPWFCRQHWRKLNGISGDSPKSVNLESILQKRMSMLNLDGPDKKANAEKARKILFEKFGSYVNLMKKQNDDEARLEREAIQQEGTLDQDSGTGTKTIFTFKDLEKPEDWNKIIGG